jgi:cytochrome P450
VPVDGGIRALMARQFTHRRVQALEPAIERLTDELLDGFVVGSPDFMLRGYEHLPVSVG